LKENAKESLRGEQIYFCPECGKPFEKVSATESHHDGIYEVNLKASHLKPH
jgi:hypothetical protein